jgi:hypothetical protein
VFLVAEIEAEPIECANQVRRSIDEKRRLLDLLLLAEFAQKQQRGLRRSRLDPPNM